MAPRVASGFLDGERIYLRAILVDDAIGPYKDWLNSSVVCRGNSHHVFPYTADQAVEYVTRVNASRDMLVLAVVLRDEDVHIGNVALQHINHINRSAEFAILMGDTGAWGRGYATEAAHLIIAHGFSALNLRRISCGTLESNTGMQRLAERLGMVKEGQRRQAIFKDGGYADVIEYGLLRSEYFSVRSARQGENSG